MNIIYIISIVAIYILFMLMHKTEKKQNLIGWLAISSILVLCYNILICLICTFIGILCTLHNLTICNIMMIAILSIILIKNKKIQKYYIKISDIIFSILTLILVIFIAYKQYGFPFNIKYEITDGSTHYFFAQQFYEKSTLLYSKSTDDFLGLYNSGFRLPGAYINEGILFTLFDEVVPKTDLFIIFDIFVLYMSAILFYSLLKTHIKENKKMNILVWVLAIMYMLGYQLNSMLYGYVYLSLALDIIIAFLLVMASCKNEKISYMVELPILSLLSLGIFFSYAYFIPIIYISILIDIIIEANQNKEKIVSIENINKMLYLIIIPSIIGISYFIIMPLVSGMKTEISTIGVNGKIYENYITNLLAFIPIVIIDIVIIIKNKKKENNYGSILFIMSLLFALILWIGNKLEIVSDYYFFKAYYIIWPLTIYNTFLSLNRILTDKPKSLKIITFIYISIYLISIIISTLIMQKNIGVNNIFYNNLNCINNEWSSFENGELKLVDKQQKTLDNDQVYILTSDYYGRTLWMSVLHKNQYIYIDYMTAYKITIEKWLEEKQEKYYLAYHKDYEELEEGYLDENNDKYKIIYNDEYGFILERNR